MPPVLARSLDTLFKGEHEVVALRDKFGQGVTDVEWITSLSHEGRWIIISGDRRITRNKAEYNAFRASRLIGFFLSASVYKSPVNKQAARLLILWDDICVVANRVQGGAMFEIPAKAKVRQLKL
jgi:PIN like domain